jgi:hypothetical protein
MGWRVKWLHSYIKRVRRRGILLVGGLAAAHLASGGESARVDQAAQVYARATNQFAAAVFLKPAQTTNADLAFQLAPLIIQQVQDKHVSPDALRDGSSTPGLTDDLPLSSFVIRHSSLPTVPRTALPRPAIWYAADSVQFEGRAHARWSYQWSYSQASAHGGLTALPRQGIRITLDTQGQPAVWEILADTSGLRLIFVSQSLEAAAAAAFGRPLPGRRYAIERGLEQAQDVIVPRVIDDGPVAMGPIVYLSEGTRNVSTLICRCMPAQVRQLIATWTFDLASLDSAAVGAFLPAAGVTSNAPPVFWPADERVENRLDHCLRLPASF